MPCVGFEAKKTVHSLDRSATVAGQLKLNTPTKSSCLCVHMGRCGYLSRDTVHIKLRYVILCAQPWSPGTSIS
jgi:hypothetical protein